MLTAEYHWQRVLEVVLVVVVADLREKMAVTRQRAERPLVIATGGAQVVLLLLLLLIIEMSLFLLVFLAAFGRSPLVLLLPAADFLVLVLRE